MKHRLLRKCIMVCGLVSGMVLAGNAAAYTESTSCSAYSTISGDPSAVILNTISNCDDCTELVALPFTFSWWGDTPITDVQVSSNGQINIDSTDTGSNCCSADPVEVGGAYTNPRIAVAQEDLDPGDAGEVYTLDTGTSFIVEYNTVFWPNVGTVNAQVEMFPNGNVELRWGSGDTAGTNSIAAGVEDDTRSVPAATPATGSPFTAGGVTDTFPTGQCRLFTAPAAPATAQSIPTLSQWGLIMLAALIGLVGFARRRKEQL